MKMKGARKYDTGRPTMTRAEVAAAPPDTILTPEEVGLWLNVKPRQLGNGSGKHKRLEVPSLPLGVKTVRYMKSDVLTWLESQRELRRA